MAALKAHTSRHHNSRNRANSEMAHWLRLTVPGSTEPCRARTMFDICARRLRELFRLCSHSQRHESDSEARLQEAAFNLTPGMTPSTDDMIRGIRCTRRRGRPDSRRLIALSSQWMPREDATHRGTRYLPASGCSLTHGLAWTAFTTRVRPPDRWRVLSI